MHHESWNELFETYIFELSLLGKFYPKEENVFRVFQMPVDQIKLVLLAQDPYHGEGQAHGLAFSVERGVKTPPSLVNIFREIKDEFPDRNYDFQHGNLEKWTERGIFLLNCSLTVSPGDANSHCGYWKEFTDDVIKFIAEHNKKCIFLLLGNPAKSKASFLNDDKCVKGVHPSPLSAHNGFFGSSVFKKVEEKIGKIDWQN